MSLDSHTTLNKVKISLLHMDKLHWPAVHLSVRKDTRRIKHRNAMDIWKLERERHRWRRWCGASVHLSGTLRACVLALWNIPPICTNKACDLDVFSSLSAEPTAHGPRLKTPDTTLPPRLTTEGHVCHASLSNLTPQALLMWVILPGWMENFYRMVHGPSVQHLGTNSRIIKSF